METEVVKKEDGFYEAEFCEAIEVKDNANTVRFETHKGRHSWAGGIREFRLEGGEINLVREKDFVGEDIILDDSRLDLIADAGKLFTAKCRNWIKENLGVAF